MFEVGFSELLLVGLVALLVIGPEKLPQVARTTGFWLGKARRIAHDLKEEVKSELHAEEMRQLLSEQQNQINDLQQMLDKESERLVHAANADVADSDSLAQPAADHER